MVDDEGVPDVDEDGRVNEDIEWDIYIPKDDTGRIEREIRQIIGNLNEDGYLETSIEELWQETQRYELETWRETLKTIQNFKKHLLIKQSCYSIR